MKPTEEMIAAAIKAAWPETLVGETPIRRAFVESVIEAVAPIIREAALKEANDTVAQLSEKHAKCADQVLALQKYSGYYLVPLASWPSVLPFTIGARVRKTSGSAWHGRVVGYYSTALTPVGICVESEREPGSVQIYPVAALVVIEVGS